MLQDDVPESVIIRVVQYKTPAFDQKLTHTICTITIGQIPKKTFN